VTINISPAAIIGDVTHRGEGGSVIKQPPSTLALFIRKTSMEAGLLLFTENKNRETRTSSLPNQCSDVRRHRPMRTNLHSLGPVVARHFSACPTHVATTQGKRRSVSRVATPVTAWATVMRPLCVTRNNEIRWRRYEWGFVVIFN
jgi:hypothetical protein